MTEYNVLDEGADYTSDTDDTAAFESAISKCSSGDVVFVPAVDNPDTESYNINTTNEGVKIDEGFNGCTLRGEGRNSIIERGGGSGVPENYAHFYLDAESATMENIIIEKLYLDGNRADFTQENGRGIIVKDSDANPNSDHNILIRGVWAVNHTNIGISLSRGARAFKCTAKNCYHGFATQYNRNNDTEPFNIVENCYTENNDYYGVDLHGKGKILRHRGVNDDYGFKSSKDFDVYNSTSGDNHVHVCRNSKFEGLSFYGYQNTTETIESLTLDNVWVDDCQRAGFRFGSEPINNIVIDGHILASNTCQSSEDPWAIRVGSTGSGVNFDGSSFKGFEVRDTNGKDAVGIYSASSGSVPFLRYENVAGIAVDDNGGSFSIDNVTNTSTTNPDVPDLINVGANSIGNAGTTAFEHGMLATSQSEVNGFENWLNATVELVSTTFSQNQQQTQHDNGTSDLDPITWGDSPYKDALQTVFGDTGRRLVLSYEMCGTEGHGNGNYSNAANGDWDADYRATAQDLIDVGCEDAIIRPNHEFNLDWNSKYPNDPANYRDAYARLVREMQSISGANFTFLFSPARNREGVAPDAWPPDSSYWPSGEDPPLVVTSNYDKSPSYDDGTTDEPTREERENAWDVTIHENIKMWTTFAEDRGARYGGSPEWGCVERGSIGYVEGGDNPWFVEKYLTYGDKNNFEVSTWWNGENANHEIWPDSTGLEDAAVRYRHFVGDRLRASGTSSTDDGGDEEPTSASGDAALATQDGAAYTLDGVGSMSAPATRTIIDNFTDQDASEWTRISDADVSVVNNPGTRGDYALRLSSPSGDTFARSTAYPGATSTDLPAYFSQDDPPLHIFMSFDTDADYSSVGWGWEGAEAGYEMRFVAGSGYMNVYDPVDGQVEGQSYDHNPSADTTYEVIVDWTSAGYSVDVKNESGTTIYSHSSSQTHSSLSDNSGVMVGKNHDGDVFVEEVYKEKP